MPTSVVLSVLSAFAAAFSPLQVKEDLEARPWRPAPSQPVASPAAPGPSSEPAAAPAKSAAPVASGAWQIQLSALSSFEAAKTEQVRLEKVLGPGKIDLSSEGSVNRLKYGAYPTKEAAEDGLESLRAKGIQGFVVKKP